MAKRLPPPPGTRLVQAYVKIPTVERFKVWCAMNGTNMTQAISAFMADKAAGVHLPTDTVAKPSKKSR